MFTSENFLTTCAEIHSFEIIINLKIILHKKYLNENI